MEMNSDWASFKDLDDSDDDYDDEILGKVDTAAYAVEDDSPEYKAHIGAERAGPSIERDAKPIQVPAGEYLSLSIVYLFVPIFYWVKCPFYFSHVLIVGKARNWNCRKKQSWAF
jgi:hypothetical protein